jgi:hypothetical protein
MEDILMMVRNTQRIKAWNNLSGDAKIGVTINEEHLKLIRGGTVPNQPPDPTPPD